MTFQIVAAVITWTAVTVACWEHARARRAVRELRTKRRTFSIPGGGEVTVTAPMSEADYESLKTNWLAAHGQTAAWVCSDYRPSTTPADSGLCARCGMYDYKHKEQPGV